MPRYRCTKHGKPPRFFEFEDPNGDGVCPQCKLSPQTARGIVRKLVYIHFIAKGSGPIMGRRGAQHVTCDPKRDHLARHMKDTYTASDDPRITNCPSCLTTKEWQERAAAFATFDKSWALALKLRQQPTASAAGT